MIAIDESLIAEAMKNYGYEIRFKDKKIKDLSAIGYLWLARQVGLSSINTELLQYNWDGKTLRVVVRVTITINNEQYSALADCDDRSMSVRSPDMVVRVADTIAMKRAIARALGIDRDQLQKYQIQSKRSEEEVYTPTPTAPPMDEVGGRGASEVDEW